MDGTGTLFAPLIQAAPAGLEVISLPLIQKSDAGYEDQARHAADSIGDEPVVLVAESYSGMVAYSMLKNGCPNIHHVVFAASFIACPSRLAVLAKYLPVALLKSSVVPKYLLGKFLFSKFSTPELVSLFDKSLSGVGNNILKTRLSQIATLPIPSMPISVPCSYIRPKGDILVSKGAIEHFQRLCPKLAVYEVDGTHFVLQTSPHQCWRVIQSAIV
ncbi:MAG: hypothetical protein EA353_00375 [Puniceicoccaceae bacterium]|nr:MAG: hypothetical protein EA353_00375 [Puniceicoccaceae bacterium]